MNWIQRKFARINDGFDRFEAWCENVDDKAFFSVADRVAKYITIVVASVMFFYLFLGMIALGGGLQ